MRATYLLSALLVMSACSSPKRTIRIPESVVPNPKGKTADKSTAQPFVIKVADGKRTFQIEVPSEQISGAINASIPLDLDTLESFGEETQQTEADREIIDAKEAAGEKTPKTAPGESAKSKSYLATLARVNELYKKRQYEIALIEITSLDREYPDDERILSMKGTLYWKLKRMKQAREAWERVLALNPDNTQVAQALEQLNQDGE
jgi:tetratricopeptide (TPR) repeat protein